MSGGNETVIKGAGVEEKHYTVQELAVRWGMSETFVRRKFQNEPGVVLLAGKGVVTGHRRGRCVMRVPKSVAERVWRRFGGGQTPQTPTPKGKGKGRA